MEGVLEVDQRAADPKRPLICLDEAVRELCADTREPLPPSPAVATRRGFECARAGPYNVFQRLSSPWPARPTPVCGSGAPGKSFAQVVKTLADEIQPERPSASCWCSATSSSPCPASQDEAFPPEEARRLTEKLELHYTPKHGSWLNMAESEISVLARQCLNAGRLASQEHLAYEVAA